jgi:hypothetical protein
MFRCWTLRLAVAVFAVTAPAHPAGFTFSVGNAVASQDFRYKTAAFVFRTEGCADPAKAQISGTAEGMVNGARRSMVLKVMATSKPGVYAVEQNWPPQGAWVVSLRGTCAEESAGAIVPFGPRGMIREAAKFFARPAADAEIDAALKALAQGGNNK